MTEPAHARRPNFRTTRWSVVLAAGGRSPDSRRALSELCAQYWFPLYAFLRRSGWETADAEDLTQGFFLRLMEKQDLAAVHPDKGRFRSFLLKALKFYAANEWDRRRAAKRGGDLEQVELSFEDGEPRYQSMGDECSPEDLYERSWARAVSAGALEAVRLDYARRGREEQFEALEGTLTGATDDSYRAIAARLDKSEGAIKVAVHRLRQRFGSELRSQVAQTVAGPEQLEAELRNLIAVLRFQD